jgi:adenylylsulfate kinase-like enzyme
MIYWITGRSSSGKSVYSKRLKRHLESLGDKVLILDGDVVRSYFPTGYSDEEREDNIMRIAKIAAIAEEQGFTVIVAVISPTKKIRMKARKLFNESILIYMPGGFLWEGTEYEEPDHEEMMCGGI